jgi:hypothetical protein
VPDPWEILEALASMPNPDPWPPAAVGTAAIPDPPLFEQAVAEVGEVPVPGASWPQEGRERGEPERGWFEPGSGPGIVGGVG